MAEERLQKIMARAGLASRRAAEEMIEKGRVTVNGQKASLGMSADPNRDDIRVDGEWLKLPETFDYFMLNKPKGVISDEDVSGEHPAARDLIPVEGHLYPVGRLDLGSEGLMLFTNDGALAHRLTHPRYDHPKTYQVLLDGNVQEETLDRWRHGIVIEGKRTRPAQVDKIKKSRSGTLLEVTLREGRKRQIRKVATTLGHSVVSLTRTKLGPLELGDLPLGAWRRLTGDEVAALETVRDAQEPRPVRRSTTGMERSKSSQSGVRRLHAGRSVRSGKGRATQTGNRTRSETQRRFGNRSGDTPQSNKDSESYRSSEGPSSHQPRFHSNPEERSSSSQRPSSERHGSSHRTGHGAASPHSNRRPTHYGGSSSNDEQTEQPPARKRPGSTGRSGGRPHHSGSQRPPSRGRTGDSGQGKSPRSGGRPERSERPANRTNKPQRGSHK